MWMLGHRLPDPRRIRPSAASGGLRPARGLPGHALPRTRPLDRSPAETGATRLELVAETGAAFLCAHVGLSSHTIDNTAAYIASWLRVLQDDRQLVLRASQRAVDYILGHGTGPELQEEPRK